jgi:hypothetical protein
MTMATSSTATQAMTRTDPSEDLLPSAAIGATCLRLTLALWWLIHWWFKVGVSGMEKTETFFLAHGGLPAWLAWFDVSFEVLVMVCLIVGILGFGRAIGRQKQSAVSPEKIWCPSFAPS